MDQANWLLTEADFAVKMACVRSTVNIPLDRDKPVPLARQIQAPPGAPHRRWAAGARREAAGHARAGPAASASTGPRWRWPTRSWWRPGWPARTWGRARSSASASARAPPVARRPAPARHRLDRAAVAQRAHRSPPTRSGGAPSAAGTATPARSSPSPAACPTARCFRPTPSAACSTRSCARRARALLQYSPVGGYTPLRRYLAGYLLRFGVEARAGGDPDRQRLAAGLRPHRPHAGRSGRRGGDRAADLSRGAMQAFRSFGARLLPVRVGRGRAAAGRLRAAAASGRRPSCSTASRAPTIRAGSPSSPRSGGACWPPPRATRCPSSRTASTAASTTARAPSPPLKAADRAGVVIYIGTFSKILFPGLRLGWLVAPPPIVERLQAAKQLADLHTSALLQAAVHRFCERRLLDRHVTRVAAEYARRRSLLLAALRRRMPEGVTWTEPQGGFSLLLTLPAGLDGDGAAAAGDRARRRVHAGSGVLPRRRRASGRCAWPSRRWPAARIDEGVRRLAEAIKAARRQPRPRRTERELVPVV